MSFSPNQGVLSTPPRIYYVNPLLLQGIDAWREVFDHAAETGFDRVLTAPLFDRGGARSIFSFQDMNRLDPQLSLGSAVEDGVGRLVEAARRSGVTLMMDLMLDGKALDTKAGFRPVDPRRSPLDPAGPMTEMDAESQSRLLEEWAERLRGLAGLGLCGYRALGIDRIAPAAFKSLISAVREKADAHSSPGRRALILGRGARSRIQASMDVFHLWLGGISTRDGSSKNTGFRSRSAGRSLFPSRHSAGGSRTEPRAAKSSNDGLSGRCALPPRSVAA